MDNRYIERDIGYQLKDGTTVHITPVVAGAKRAGIFSVIIGVVLMVASIWTGGATFASGLAMTLGGVAQMLTRKRSRKAKIDVIYKLGKHGGAK